MKWTRSLVRLRSAFTLLEVVVAGLLLSTILAGSYSMMMGNMGTVRTLSESSHSRIDVRNTVEVIRSLGFDELLTACGLRNPCTSTNSNVNSLLPGELQQVQIEIRFEDENGQLSTEPTYARIHVKTTDGSEYFTGIAQSMSSPNSNYGSLIYGYVRDDLGNPIAGATVDIRQADNTLIDTLTTDAAGYYQQRVPRGLYHLTASKTHYATQSKNDQDLNESRAIDFVLERRFRIYGLVVDDRGMPLEGVQVQISGANGSFSAVTTATGEFFISNVRPGNYSVSLVKPNYETRSGIPLALSPHPDVTFNSTLERRITLTGTIRNDAPGNPVISGAQVRLQGNGIDRTVFTNSAGVYTFNNVRPGVYTLTVSASNHDTRSEQYDIQVHPTQTLNVILNRTVVEVKGNVKDDAGSNVPGATITLFGGPGGTYSAVTNASGDYSIPGVLIGTYSLSASKTGHRTFTLTTVNAASNPTTVDLTLERRLVLTGHVQNANTGEAIEGATVRVSGGPGGTYTVSTDASGAFAINDIMPGTYTITITKAGFSEWSGARVINSNAQIYVEMHPAEKSTVTNAQTTVTLDPGSGKTGYSFFYLPPGEHDIWVNGYLHGHASLLTEDYGVVDIWRAASNGSPTRMKQWSVKGVSGINPISNSKTIDEPYTITSQGQWFLVRAMGTNTYSRGRVTITYPQSPIEFSVSPSAPAGTYDIEVVNISRHFSAFYRYDLVGYISGIDSCTVGSWDDNPYDKCPDWPNIDTRWYDDYERGWDLPEPAGYTINGFTFHEMRSSTLDRVGPLARTRELKAESWRLRELQDGLCNDKYGYSKEIWGFLLLCMRLQLQLVGRGV